MAFVINPAGSIVADLNIHTVANVLEQSTLQNIREIQHKDVYGNDIGMYSHPPRSCPFIDIAIQLTRIAQTQLVLAWKDLWTPSETLRKLLMMDTKDGRLTRMVC
jgi:hypothetical protein